MPTDIVARRASRPLAAAVGPTYELGPEGLLLLRPATLSLDAAEAVLGDATAPRMYSRAGELEGPIAGSALIGSRVVASISHFSPYAVGLERSAWDYANEPAPLLPSDVRFNAGIALVDSTGLVEANTVRDLYPREHFSLAGIFQLGGTVAIRGNTVARLAGEGVHAHEALGLTLRDNDLSSGELELLRLVDPPAGLLVYHNNLTGYGGPGSLSAHAVTADAPAVLDFRADGNFWDRTSAPLFVRNWTSNRPDRVDRFPFCRRNGWSLGDEPCTCGGAPLGPQCLALDGDGDGFLSVAEGGQDCDDTNAMVYPGAPEMCDGLDNDCDGAPEAPGSCVVWPSVTELVPPVYRLSLAATTSATALTMIGEGLSPVVAVLATPLAGEADAITLAVSSSTPSLLTVAVAPSEVLSRYGYSITVRNPWGHESAPVAWEPEYPTPQLLDALSLDESGTFVSGGYLVDRVTWEPVVVAVKGRDLLYPGTVILADPVTGEELGLARLWPFAPPQAVGDVVTLELSYSRPSFFFGEERELYFEYPPDAAHPSGQRSAVVRLEPMYPAATLTHAEPGAIIGNRDEPVVLHGLHLYEVVSARVRSLSRQGVPVGAWCPVRLDASAYDGRRVEVTVPASCALGTGYAELAVQYRHGPPDDPFPSRSPTRYKSRQSHTWERWVPAPLAS